MSFGRFIVEVFCLTDEMLTDFKRQLREEGRPLRARGHDPTVDDSVVLTCDPVGEFLQKNTDSAIFTYFRRHHEDLFPDLQKIHRSASHSPIGEPVGGKGYASQAASPASLAKPPRLGRSAPLGRRQFPNAGLPVYSGLAMQGLSGGSRLWIRRDHQTNEAKDFEDTSKSLGQV
ncbi:MAG: hypothetical protein ABEL04_13500 [Salinibacter sp.]|uniref:hypothetical protein n=1 Tax=Salinibacter sp. TaxID=2065818 RepID=UPI0035D42ED6